MMVRKQLYRAYKEMVCYLPGQTVLNTRSSTRREAVLVDALNSDGWIGPSVQSLATRDVLGGLLGMPQTWSGGISGKSVAL